MDWNYSFFLSLSANCCRLGVQDDRRAEAMNVIESTLAALFALPIVSSAPALGGAPSGSAQIPTLSNDDFLAGGCPVVR